MGALTSTADQLGRVRRRRRAWLVLGLAPAMAVACSSPAETVAESSRAESPPLSGPGTPEAPGVASDAGIESDVAVGGDSGSEAEAPVGEASPDGAGSAVEAGTDSAVTEAPAAVPEELETALVDFGRYYLEYDYRIPDADRIEPLRDLTSPELFAELSEPTPPALAELLAAEQRVVTAELTSLQPLEAGVFELLFAVTVNRVDAADPGSSATSTEDTKVLVVSVGPDGRVSDVR